MTLRFRAENPQLLGTTVQNLVARATDFSASTPFCVSNFFKESKHEERPPHFPLILYHSCKERTIHSVPKDF